MSVVSSLAGRGDADPRPVDVVALVEVALTAFARDVSYAVSMAKSAAAISRKRESFAAQRADRDAALADLPEQIRRPRHPAAA